jgi:hypothetical protein
LGVTVGAEEVVGLDGTFAGRAGVSLLDTLEQGFLLQRPLISLSQGLLWAEDEVEEKPREVENQN